MSSTASPVHVVVGAGPVGRALAAQLAAAGHPVRVLTRSGTGPDLPGVELRAVDATRPELLAEVASAAGLPMVRIAPLGRLGIRAVGMVMPSMRPMADTFYQFDRPFVVDDRAAREAFGIAPTPWAELVAEVADTALTARRTASQAA